MTNEVGNQRRHLKRFLVLRSCTCVFSGRRRSPEEHIVFFFGGRDRAAGDVTAGQQLRLVPSAGGCLPIPARLQFTVTKTIIKTFLTSLTSEPVPLLSICRQQSDPISPSVQELNKMEVRQALKAQLLPPVSPIHWSGPAPCTLLKHSLLAVH